MIAVAEWQLEQAQQFATDNNIGKAYGNFEDLARDDDVQIVYIAIVNSYHYKLAKLMLDNDKHVLIEKPLTLCAKRNNLSHMSKLQLNFNYKMFLNVFQRFYHDHLTLNQGK